MSNKTIKDVIAIGTITASIVLLIGLILLPGCDQKQKSVDQVQREKTERSMQEAERQVGMPNITNFQERRLAKQIFELRDQEDLITYAYIVNHMTGELVFIGKCIGFGLPYSVQYTSPSKMDAQYVDTNSIGAGRRLVEGVTPQPDPNGLFMPQGLSATWLMMIDDEGEARPVYVEPEILVSPFPLHKD